MLLNICGLWRMKGIMVMQLQRFEPINLELIYFFKDS